MPLADPGLNLAASHGLPGQQITATLDSQVDGSCAAAGQAAFYWDGQLQGTSPISATCQASFRFTPPRGQDSAGQHLVRVTAQTPQGEIGSDEKPYTIDLAVVPSRITAPQATSSPASLPEVLPVAGTAQPYIDQRPFLGVPVAALGIGMGVLLVSVVIAVWWVRREIRRDPAHSEPT